MSPTPPGWYGKIAALGDFASRRLPPPWIAACDNWLATVLTSARAELGPQWLDVYLSAPLMRFAWTRGAIDERWWMGVLMPSCDSVGRYFPLVIASSDVAAPTTLQETVALERWYAEVGSCALATLDDAGSLDGLERELSQVASWRDAAPSSDTRPEAFALLETFATLRASARPGGRSAWWAQDDSSASATIVDGLPDSACFADLLAWRPHDDLSTVVRP